MSKHTPGPWEVQYTIVIGPDSEAVAHCPFDGEKGLDMDTRKANARFIAACPDMLKALKDALDWMQRYCPPESHFYEITQVKAAIAKAEGK